MRALGFVLACFAFLLLTGASAIDNFHGQMASLLETQETAQMPRAIRGRMLKKKSDMDDKDGEDKKEAKLSCSHERVPPNCITAWEYVSSQKDLSVYKAAIKATKAKGALKCPGVKATFFAATNDAWKELFSYYGLKAKQLWQQGQVTVDAILRYNTALQRLSPADLVRVGSLSPFDNQNITVTADSKTIYLEGHSGIAAISQDGVATCQSVVYKLDSILLPDFDLLQDDPVFKNATVIVAPVPVTFSGR